MDKTRIHPIDERFRLIEARDDDGIHWNVERMDYDRLGAERWNDCQSDRGGYVNLPAAVYFALAAAFSGAKPTSPKLLAARRKFTLAAQNAINGTSRAHAEGALAAIDEIEGKSKRAA